MHFDYFYSNVFIELLYCNGSSLGRRLQHSLQHRYRRYRLLTRLCRRSRIKNSRWRSNGANVQVTEMEKAFLGAYFWKLIFQINRNRQYTQNKTLPKVLEERKAFN